MFAGPDTGLRARPHLHRCCCCCCFRQVTQHPSCQLAVQVLKETSSGEHKFKVTTVVAKAELLE